MQVRGAPLKFRGSVGEIGLSFMGMDCSRLKVGSGKLVLGCWCFGGKEFRFVMRCFRLKRRDVHGWSRRVPLVSSGGRL